MPRVQRGFSEVGVFLWARYPCTPHQVTLEDVGGENQVLEFSNVLAQFRDLSSGQRCVNLNQN